MSYFDFIELSKTKVQVHVFLERRNNVRFGFGKKGLLIRIPNHFHKKEIEIQINKGIEWGRNALQSNNDLLLTYHKKNYKTGTIITTFCTRYEMVRTDNIEPNVIKIVDSTIQSHPRTTIYSKDISKLLTKVYKPLFEKQLAYWASKFPVSYNKMSLKYNSSNWGSCSSKQNINLSTRLFLCPVPVINYVMIHELAHLIHHNHSKQFWQLVESVMPEYAVHNQWLKVNGAPLDF